MLQILVSITIKFLKMKKSLAKILNLNLQLRYQN
jgi:hypothetical protein